MLPKKKLLTRTVWILSLVSMLTDIASEMLYPIMPLYLTSIGFSTALIGLLEGMAEAIAGLGKGYFGQLSDRIGRKKPFIQLGYGLSALSKPMMALSALPLWIFTARSLDRVGKGIRTGARDALLSAETTAEHKATVFGFHRSLDTLGATIGPIIALIFLYFYPAHYITLFWIAFIPGLLAILLTFLVTEKLTPPSTSPKKPTSFLAFLQYWQTSPAAYRPLVIGLLLFTLFNSSDAFLLLMLKYRQWDDTAIIMVYIFYNAIYALLAYSIGQLADKFGLKQSYLFGLTLFCLVYLGMAFNTNTFIFYGLFFLYGLYAASTESVAKAWISNICPKAEVATAIGMYSAFNSLGALMASSVAGMIWYTFSPQATFLTSVVGVMATILYFVVRVE
jgi:MFS family permease